MSENRDYFKNPWNLRDLAKTLAWEEVDASTFDISWYIGNAPEDDDACATMRATFESFFIARDADWLTAAGAGDTAPADYVLCAFTTNDGGQHLMTYADGFGFEYTDKVSWAHAVGLASSLTTKSDWPAVIDWSSVFES